LFIRSSRKVKAIKHKLNSLASSTSEVRITKCM